MKLQEISLSLELDREDDGRWIAEVPELPGVLVYGASQAEAEDAAMRLAFQVIAEMVEHGELKASHSLTKPLRLPLVHA